MFCVANKASSENNVYPVLLELARMLAEALNIFLKIYIKKLVAVFDSVEGEFVPREKDCFCLL